MSILARGRLWLGTRLMRLGFRVAGGDAAAGFGDDDAAEELGRSLAGPGGQWAEAPPVEVGERGRRLLREGMAAPRAAETSESARAPLAGSLADRRARGARRW